MKKCLLLGLMFLSLNCFSQNRNSVWCFGDSAGIDFGNINNPVTFYSRMDGKGSCASISDSSGNLLFYAYNLAGNGDSVGRIFSSNHVLMQNGSSIIGTGLFNELVIIPNPGINNEYFLFNIGELSPFSQGLLYNKIDISLNNGLGSVVQKNKRLNNFRNADCLSAIKHGNGMDWWVLSKYSNTSAPTLNRTYVYLVTQDSVHTPLIQDLNNSTDCDNQYFVFNHDGTKFMQTNGFGFMCQFDFDRCSGIISNPSIIYPEQTSGYDRIFQCGAYSPSDSLFYVTTRAVGSHDTTRLIQFNLNAANIPNSADTLFMVKHPIQTGAIRLAPDKKMYLATVYFAAIPNGYPYPDSIRFQCNENLSVINYPDSLGSACDFQPYSFYLGGKRTYWGLPNNPNYDLGSLLGSGCDTLANVSQSLSIKEASLNVYYHPSWQTLFVNAQNIKGKNCLLQIFDMDSRCVFTLHDKAINGYFAHDVPLHTTANGIYVLKLTTEKETLTSKFPRQ